MKNYRILATAYDTAANHRADFETCPHCSHMAKENVWEAAAHILVLQPRCYKFGSVAVLSECPKCFGDSWVHVPTHTVSLYDWPQEWQDRAEEQEKTQKLTAVREWGACLCWKCKLLESAKIEYHCWVQCHGCSGPAKRECQRFDQI